MAFEEPEVTLTIRQGQTDTIRIGPWTADDGTVVSFTGYKARAHGVRAFGTDPSLWELSSTDGSITFEDDGGTTDAVIVMHFDTALTKTLNSPGNSARWDIEIYDDAPTPEISDRVMRGPYKLSLEATD